MNKAKAFLRGLPPGLGLTEAPREIVLHVLRRAEDELVKDYDKAEGVEAFLRAQGARTLARALREALQKQPTS